jgi:hypothetical protein
MDRHKPHSDHREEGSLAQDVGIVVVVVEEEEVAATAYPRIQIPQDRLRSTWLLYIPMLLVERLVASCNCIFR